MKQVGPEPIRPKHLEVTARPNEGTDRMIRRFSKKVRNDGILGELYLRRFYEKPSQARRRKRARAAATRAREARLQKFE